MIKKIICSSLLILAVPFLMSSVKAPVYNGPKKNRQSIPLLSMRVMVDMIPAVGAFTRMKKRWRWP